MQIEDNEEQSVNADSSIRESRDPDTSNKFARFVQQSKAFSRINAIDHGIKSDDNEKHRTNDSARRRGSRQTDSNVKLSRLLHNVKQ
jgi:hypothetical protein